MITRLRQRFLFRTVISEILGWLTGEGHPLSVDTMSGWGAGEWKFVRDVVFTHGVGAYLRYALLESEIYHHFPTEFRAWLEREYQNNARRIERMCGDLHRFLVEATKSGLAVMPLKGALLSTTCYPEPALRPMADIDLLVQPEDREPARAILSRLGYRLIPTTSIYPNHDFYLNPDGEQIVNRLGEDHRNPRPIEIHAVIRRTLWGDIGKVDLTEMMWDDSYLGEFLGERVMMPSNRALFHHVATHAMQHFVNSSGRIIMWLDLALLQTRKLVIEPIEYANFVYPIIRLAQRALPGQLDALHTHRLAEQVHGKLRTWCEQAPLDDRCGLDIRHKPEQTRPALSFTRWSPKPWRLSIGYGDISYIQALVQHFAAVVRHYPHRVR